MIVGVPAESRPGERRVALVPAVVPVLAKAGAEVLVEPGAGARAGFPDGEYERHGARLAADRDALFATAEVVLSVGGLSDGPAGAGAEVASLRSGQLLIGLLNPYGAPRAVQEIATRGVTAFALELLPRISRAQPMDALTSMATVAGYKSVLLAAAALDKLYPMMITAAGTITPARVFVVGAGVAGLQAIATARRLGAVVHAYDVRPAVREQVESLGARFVEMALDSSAAEGQGGYAQEMDESFYRRQREMMTTVVAESDVVITTAAIPGRKSPVLLTEAMVRGMRPGSVIVDLAAEGGGNCELTRPGETATAGGVTILAPLHIAATVPHHASQMFARNTSAFLRNLIADGELRLDPEDPIVRDSLLTRDGEVVPNGVRELLGLPVSAPESS